MQSYVAAWYARECWGSDIFFSLTEPPLPDPTQHPKTRQKSPDTDRNGPETDRNGRIGHFYQCHAEGGATKGGVSKCEQTRINAEKRWQTQANAEAKTQANASKSEQTWTNENKRLHPPLLRFFTPPFAILLFLQVPGLGRGGFVGMGWPGGLWGKMKITLVQVCMLCRMQAGQRTCSVFSASLRQSELQAWFCWSKSVRPKIRTHSTTTSDRNLQFWGIFSMNVILIERLLKEQHHDQEL